MPPEVADWLGDTPAVARSSHINPRLIAVEYNGQIVRRDGYDAVLLAAGDKVEIVHMVGGGAP